MTEPSGAITGGDGAGGGCELGVLSPELAEGVVEPQFNWRRGRLLA